MRSIQGITSAVVLQVLLLLAGCSDDPTTPDATTGRIVVNAEPDSIAAPWVLEHPDESFSPGQGDSTFTGMLPGTYKLSWREVDGWVLPDPSSQSLSLVAGATITFDGSYTGLSSIIIDPSPDSIEAPWVLELPSNMPMSGSGNTFLSNMALGTYTLTWYPVSDWLLPIPHSQTLELTEGAAITFAGTYAGLGTIVVDALPGDIAAPWTLVLPDDSQYTGAGDSTLVEMLEGDYTLTWGDLEGWQLPDPAVQSSPLVPLATLIFAGEYQPLYHAPTEPDSVLANFLIAWDKMDIAGYRDHVLYDGTLHASDEELYAAFLFYFREEGPGQDEFPDFHAYEEEVAIVQRILSGTVGMNDLPGVKGIDIALAKIDDWADPVNPTDVEGDPYPLGTKRCLYSTDMIVRLKDFIPQSVIDYLIVDDDIEFHVVPVLANDRTEYRIWKWRDHGTNLRTEDSSWSLLKVVY